MKIIRSNTFNQWLHSLRDSTWKARIAARIDAIATVGHFGDTKYLRGGISELRFKTGVGYRIYYAKHGDSLVILLCAGDKSSQKKDIEIAIKLLKDWQNE